MPSQNVFMKANSGFSAVTMPAAAGAAGEPVLANRGMVRLLPTAQPFNGGPGFHTWVNEDPEPLFQPRNIINAGWNSNDSPSNPFIWKTLSGDCAFSQPPVPNSADAHAITNGVYTGTIGHLGKSGCGVLLHGTFVRDSLLLIVLALVALV